MLDKSDLKAINFHVTKSIKTELKPVKSDISKLKKDIGGIKEDVSHIRKDIKVIVTFFDREYLELRKRVDRIEEHLGIAAI